MRLVMVVVPVVLAVAAAGAAEYGMADLQALDKAGGWEELVQHLGDIPPSKRDANWLGLAERGGAGYLASIPISDDNPEAVQAAAERLLQRFPQLKQSKPFMARRAELGLKSFKYSYGKYSHRAGDDKWIEQLKLFVAADGVTPDLAKRAGELVASRLVAQCAWPFFKMALDKGGAALCKDGEFKRSIVAAFTDGVWKAEISDVAQNRCWGDLKDPLLAEFRKTDNDDLIKLLCPILKAKNALAAADAAKCVVKPQ